MLKITVLAILLLLVSCGESTSVAKRGSKKFCGKVLAQTLSILCGGKYFHPDNINDNDNNNNIKKRDLGSEIDGVFPHGWNFLLPYPRMDVGGRRPFERRGVVDECCDQPCSVPVLLSYCA